MECRLSEILERLSVTFLRGLLAPEEAAGLLDTARRLPPIHWGILECRLAADESQVDLSQRITGHGDERQVLVDHIREVWQRETSADVPAWDKLVRFLNTWANTSLHASAPILWLEFDGVARQCVPSMFFTPRADEVPLTEAIATSQKIVSSLLSPRQLATLEAPLAQCFENCPGESFVGQVGLMLSRQTDALRVCIEELSGDQVVPVLRQNGYADLGQPVDSFIERVLGLAGEFRMLDLDIGSGPHDTFGLEVSFEGLSDEKSRWLRFLDELERAGLCTPAKRDSVINWCGTLQLQLADPADDPWLLQLVKLKISHLKLVYRPGKPIVAKAYLWFGESWQ